MEFEWDDAKDAENRRKHGLPLADAARLDWVAAIEVPDERKNYGEKRSTATAPLNGRLHVCIFTRRNHVLRVISLRKANSREVRDYGTI